MNGQLPINALEVGREYVAIGPNPDARPSHMGKSASGWWEPGRVTVESVDEKGYIVSGKKLVSPRIMFGCEHYWRPA